MMIIYIRCTRSVYTRVNYFSLFADLAILSTLAMNIVMNDIKIVMEMMLIDVLDLILARSLS
jgi:hypothetical protein